MDEQNDLENYNEQRRIDDERQHQQTYIEELEMALKDCVTYLKIENADYYAEPIANAESLLRRNG